MLIAITKIGILSTSRASLLKAIVDGNPFIPQGREPLYARGLLAGLHGDCVIAAHLLIPQLENSLRHLLKLIDVEDEQ